MDEWQNLLNGIQCFKLIGSVVSEKIAYDRRTYRLTDRQIIIAPTRKKKKDKLI